MYIVLMNMNMMKGDGERDGGADNADLVNDVKVLQGSRDGGVMWG